MQETLFGTILADRDTEEIVMDVLKNHKRLVSSWFDIATLVRFYLTIELKVLKVSKIGVEQIDQLLETPANGSNGLADDIALQAADHSVFAFHGTSSSSAFFAKSQNRFLMADFKWVKTLNSFFQTTIEFRIVV